MAVQRNRATDLKSIETQCEEDLQRAQEKGWENPDFDYRNIYHHGDKIFYVLVEPTLGIKEIAELTVSTVYPRTVIAYYPKGKSLCIAYSEQDKIFFSRKEATEYFNSITVENKHFTTQEFE